MDSGLVTLLSAIVVCVLFLVLFYEVPWRKSKTTTIGEGDIVWSGELGLFVAIARTQTGNRIITSPEGRTWTTRCTPVDDGWLCIKIKDGEFEIPLTKGRVMRSPDSIHWTVFLEDSK